MKMKVWQIDYVSSVLTDNFNENDTFDDEHPCIGVIVDKLKSLCPQKQWKPSEEQMKQLQYACENGTTYSIDVLKELLEQLKAL